MKKSDSNSVQALDPVVEAVQLYRKLAKEENPGNEDVDRLGRMIVSTPDIWSLATNTTSSIRQALIEKISGSASRACMLAEGDVLKKQFDYDSAPLIEKLLIDHILNARLRLIHAEYDYTQRVVNPELLT